MRANAQHQHTKKNKKNQPKPLTSFARLASLYICNALPTHQHKENRAMSIYMRKTHPAFDMTKEVMCLLPHLPHGSELDMMAEDLGISRESLNVHLKSIGEKYRLTMRPGSDDMAVGVGRLGWASLKEEAYNYYTTVYGDTSNGI